MCLWVKWLYMYNDFNRLYWSNDYKCNHSKCLRTVYMTLYVSMCLMTIGIMTLYVKWLYMSNVWRLDIFNDYVEWFNVSWLNMCLYVKYLFNDFICVHMSNKYICTMNLIGSICLMTICVIILYIFNDSICAMALCVYM